MIKLLTIWSTTVLMIALSALIMNHSFVNSSNGSDVGAFSDMMNKELNNDDLNKDRSASEHANDEFNNQSNHGKQLSSLKGDKGDKEDAYNRIMDLFSEENDTPDLDMRSLSLDNGFRKLNEEIANIYREELSNLRKNPDDVFVDKSKTGALEQNSDPMFYNWFAFGLTTRKIVLGLTHSLSVKFIEHSDIALTPKCMLSMLIALDEMKRQRLWVIKMLDTTGKPEFHNILDGSMISLGGYDQCLAIESPKLLKGQPGKIYGKYCLVKYDVPLPVRPKNIDIRTRLFNYTNTKLEGTAIDDFGSFAHALYDHKPRLGFCVPSQCTKSDLQLLLNIYFKNSTMSSHVDYCYSPHDYPESTNVLSKLGLPIEEMTNLQKYILIIYTVVVVSVIIGTAIDLWLSTKEQNELSKFNKLSEQNLKIIFNLNGRAQPLRSFEQPQSVGKYLAKSPSLPAPPALPTPSTSGNYGEESPFFNEKKGSLEMKDLDAETRRRLFRSQNMSTNTMNTLNPQIGTIVSQTSSVDERNQFAMPESFDLFNYWRISKKNKILRSFVAFSLYTNARRLFQNSTTSNDALDSLHGIRVISMFWIVLTHTYLLPIKSTMIYSRNIVNASESYVFQFIVNGWILVDSFFFVGSLLVTFNQLRTLNRTNGRINLFRTIIARLIRISPSLWFSISLVFVLPLFARGPLVHDYMQKQLENCENGWWLNVVFINNWFPLEKICLLNTWYLSVDLQMYIASLLIIMILYKWPLIGCTLSMIGVVASCAGTFLITYLNNHPPTVIFNRPSEIETMRNAEIYTSVLPHMAPYCLGILAGFLLFKRRTPNINRYIVFIVWITAITVAFTILIWTQKWNEGERWTPLSSATYAGLHRFLWALVLFWITFACSTSHGGFINSFLAWNFFKFLSKLSFSFFLIHFLVILARLSYTRNALAFNHYTMVCEYVVNVVFSLIASIVLHLFIELPSINLYNVYFLGSFELFTLKMNRKLHRKDTSSKNNSSFWFM